MKQDEIGGPRCGGRVHKDTVSVKRSEQLLQIMMSTESSMHACACIHFAGWHVCLLQRPYLNW
jgi:hypothetical protein